MWSGACRSRAHQPEQRRDEALGLPKRQVEEHAQGQRRQDRQVRVALLPATTPGRRRGPRTESVLGEPDGDIASGAQPALVRRPVPDPIPLLVLGVHPAGFRRGHGFAPSTAWYAGARDPGYSCTNPPHRRPGPSEPDGSMVDQVGMSAGSAFKEGTPLSSFPSSNANRNYARTGFDTNNNTADFLLISPSTPRTSASLCSQRDDATAVLPC